MKTILKYSATYGLLSGAVIASVITVGLNFASQLKALHSETFGYLVMLVALSFIFVGVKRYRDVERGGVIGFLPAFGLGLAIATFAGIAYVAVWESYLAISHYDFINDYIAGALRDARASGKSADELAKMTADFDAMRIAYANPLFRLPMTFIELFPVGVLIALVSAGLLRFPKFLPARDRKAAARA